MSSLFLVLLKKLLLVNNCNNSCNKLQESYRRISEKAVYYYTSSCVQHSTVKRQRNTRKSQVKQCVEKACIKVCMCVSVVR